MASRQYIGARYVPKFDGVHDSTKAYEPLTIVTDVNEASSYTSKKFVPVGISLTNTEYWALTGTLSGSVLELQNRMTIAETDIETLNGEVETLDNKINARKRKAIYLGNSYAGGVGSSTGNNGIFARTRHIFDDAYLFAGSGTGFLPYTSRTVTFESLLDDAIASASINNNEITDIIIVGAWGETCACKELGQNQFITDVTNAMTSIRAKMRANFPNLKRVTYTWAETRGIHDISTAVGTSHYSEPFRIHRLMSILCNRLDFEYLGWIGWASFMRDNMMSNDHYHPNDGGYVALSSAFLNAYNGHFEYYPFRSGKTQKVSGLGGNLRITYDIDVLPDGAVVNIKDVYMDANAQTIAQYTSGALIDFSDATYMVPIPFGNYEVGIFNMYLGTDSAGLGANKFTVRVTAEATSDGTGTQLKATTYNQQSSTGSIRKLYDGGQFICNWNL